MHTLLTTTRPLTLLAYKHPTDFEERRGKNLAAVTEARKKVQVEITDLKDKVKMAKETIAKFKSEIIKCQNDRGYPGSATNTAAFIWHSSDFAFKEI